MKTFKLHLKDAELYKELSQVLSINNIVKSFEYDNDVVIVSLYDNCKENLLDFYFNLGIYLVLRYVKIEGKKYESKFYEDIELAVCGTNYYYRVMFVELVKYFKDNDVLKETVFLRFNTAGFKEEVLKIYENVKYQEEKDTLCNSIQNNLAKLEIDIEKYKVLKVEYNSKSINLIARDGDVLSAKNIKNKLKIDLKIEKTDNYISDLAFCSIVCNILATKKIIIPKEYIEIYNGLISHTDLIKSGVKIILE